MVTKGSGDDGNWRRRESGDEGSVVNEGAVVRKGSGDEGKWWRWEVGTKGSGDEGNAAKCIVVGRKPEHETWCFSV